ncbi:SAVMC3_10250 family protein [Gordonia rubripertincta]|uniref:SAVMC3_10250 family protein n=1 Tax=Gordonia rubripertincta TaxID=36822 RepID=A0ABT4MZZ5_GORRU|nr:SAVMC3_10250 family protein [Gordonia rubripertincta]MCZ4552265.1 SAVMC3_10250 family protein [Gordonia rubripertincta]
MGRSPVRDYIYISRSKVERLAATLPRKTLKQISSIDLSVMGVGAGIGLHNPPNAHIIELTEAVDTAIRDSHTVYHPAELDVKPGHYIGGSASLGYGVHAARGSMAQDAAVFIGGSRDVGLCLVGSAAHMLDRTSPANDVGAVMSVPQAAYAFLDSVSRPARSATGRENGSENDWRLAVGYPFSMLRDQYCEGSQFELSYLARVHRVIEIYDEHSGTVDCYVLGSPIWVTLDVPS